MDFKRKVSEDKLKKIASAREKSKSQLELRRAKQYNLSNLPDQRAIKRKKIKKILETQQQEAKKREEKLRRKEQKEAQRIAKLNAELKAKEEAIRLARLKARRFSAEIADRVVLISSRLSTTRI